MEENNLRKPKAKAKKVSETARVKKLLKRNQLPITSRMLRDVNKIIDSALPDVLQEEIKIAKMDINTIDNDMLKPKMTEIKHKACELIMSFRISRAPETQQFLDLTPKPGYTEEELQKKSWEELRKIVEGEV
jgi:hypothetical protein